jgi:hypothetical protein
MKRCVDPLAVRTWLIIAVRCCPWDYGFVGGGCTGGAIRAWFELSRG